MALSTNQKTAIIVGGTGLVCFGAGYKTAEWTDKSEVKELRKKLNEEAKDKKKAEKDKKAADKKAEKDKKEADKKRATKR